MTEPTREERQEAKSLAAVFWRIHKMPYSTELELVEQIARALATHRGGDVPSTPEIVKGAEATTLRATPASDAAPAEARLAGALTTQEERDLIGCTRDDPCAYDHTCKSHRLFADVQGQRDARRPTLAEIEAALRAVPLVCRKCPRSHGDDLEPDYPAMARAVLALMEER